jgi:integrase
VLGLQWKDIDGTTLRVDRQLLGRKTDEDTGKTHLEMSLPKGKRARTLDLSDETLTLLREHKREQAELKTFCKAAGVKEISVHGLRHTCATLLLSAGVPAHVVQRRLGHKSIEMTLNLYAHVLPSMQADAANRLAALLHG